MGAIFNQGAARTQSASAATLSPAKPTNANAVGVMIAYVTSKNNATHSTATSGWTLVSQVNSGASFTASLWIAAGSAAAPVFTWTGAAACSAKVIYYQEAFARQLDVSLGATASNSGLTATHSTASITSTRNDSLAVYVDVAAANAALTTPSGWTSDVSEGSATDAGRGSLGNKPLATSGSTSGAISVTGANAAWVQWQIEIRVQVGATNTLEVSKLEAHAWLDVPTGLSVAKLEANAWLDAPLGLSVAKLELSAWLDVTPNEFGVSKLEVSAWLDPIPPSDEEGSICILW